MKIITLLAIVLSLSTAQTALACSKHSKQAMSCIEGTAWDSESETCQPKTSS